MVEKCVVFGCSNSRNKEKGISMHTIPSDLRSHYTFNASCFGMVSFSYVTAKKKCQLSDPPHWLVPNESTRQKFVQWGLKCAKI